MIEFKVQQHLIVIIITISLNFSSIFGVDKSNEKNFVEPEKMFIFLEYFHVANKF